MPLTELKFLALILIFLSGLVGGLLPWRFQRSNRVDYYFSIGNAFAGGVFLAVGLIHMLADADESFSTHFPDVDYPIVFLLAGCTFMGLLFIERILGTHDFDEVELAQDRGKGSAISSISCWILLVTLSIHSLLAGLALGVQSDMADTGIIMIALLAHKGVAAFALGVSLFRTNQNFRSSCLYIALFSLMTPIGIAGGVLFDFLFSGAWREILEGAFNAMAAGTFLYIASLDVFSEEFLRPKNRIRKFLASLIGFAAMALVAIWT